MASNLWYPGRNGIWQQAGFTVPASATEVRVQERAPQYMQKYAALLERAGYTVLEMKRPAAVPCQEPGRKRYVIRAFVQKRPEVTKIDVPDKAVPELEKVGWRLAE